MALQKASNPHRVSAGDFQPEDLESTHGELQQMMRVKALPTPASLRTSAFFKEVTRNEYVFMRLDEDCRAAIHEAICAAHVAHPPRKRNDHRSMEILRKFACDLSKMRKLTETRLKELQNLCTPLHHVAHRILTPESFKLATSRIAA